MKNILKIAAGLLLTALLWVVACNEPVERLETRYGLSGTDYESGRVLLIIIDGASGKAVKNAVNTRNAQTIRAMLDYSMHTFEGLADSRSDIGDMTVERGWANLLTGITGHELGDNPSFIRLAKDACPGVRSSLYASNAYFRNTFGKDMDISPEIAGNDDASVCNEILSELGGANPADIIVAQFSGVDVAGKAGGFYESGVEATPSGSVIDAVKKVDGYIGQVITTLQARTNYEKENWLIVITSGYGGEYEGKVSGTGYYDYPDRNVFTLMYNSRFASGLLQRPGDEALKYSYYSPMYSGSNGVGTHNAVMQDPDFFQMDKRWNGSVSAPMDTKEYTIQFKMFDSYATAGGQYAGEGSHIIMSKRNGTSGAGWNILFSGNQVRINSNNINGNVTSTSNPRRTGWHTYTVVWHERKASNYGDTVYVYVDGKFEHKDDCRGDRDMITSEPVTIGNTNNVTTATTGFIITDIQFYDIGLKADFIAENHCKTRLDELGETYEYWDNLLAYYPCDREEDASLSYLKDYSQYSSDKKRMYFNQPRTSFTPPNNQLVFEQARLLTTTICPRPDDSYFHEVFNTVDISVQAMQWLGISIDTGWGLEGLGWPPKYAIMY